MKMNQNITPFILQVIVLFGKLYLGLALDGTARDWNEAHGNGTGWD